MRMILRSLKTVLLAQEAVNKVHRFTAAVVVVESPQTPEDDPEERLRTRWETGNFVDGLPKAQSLAVRVEGGATEPQVVVCLIFIIA